MDTEVPFKARVMATANKGNARPQNNNEDPSKKQLIQRQSTTFGDRYEQSVRSGGTIMATVSSTSNTATSSNVNTPSTSTPAASQTTRSVSQKHYYSYQY
jgi:hypothetical protein